MEIGNKIRKIRELKGYSQDYVASKLGMTQKNFSKIERDEINLNVDKLEEIANVLGVDVFYLLSFDERVVLNNTFNNQSGGNGNNIVLKGDFENEKKLYEQLIKRLEEENALLKKLLKI